MRLLSCRRCLLWLGANPGHQIVGSIAEQLLQPAKTTKIRDMLDGMDLATAATWADCARDVHKLKDGSFKWIEGNKTPNVCKPMSDDEKHRMEAYAERNWRQCTYTSTEGCLGTYHFADVAIQHDHYPVDFAYKGTGEHDIVSAILACMAVLQNKPAPVPFNIIDKREALLLLAHFVGDLHQPLHVGAVYLDSSGALVNPDEGAFDPATETRGGNSIHKTTDPKNKANLHGAWDDIPTSLGTSANATMVAMARDKTNVPATDGTMRTWPVQWATQTIREAQRAFQGVTFTRADNFWVYEAPDGYSATRSAMQKVQLARGGAHLAQLLDALIQ